MGERLDVRTGSDIRSSDPAIPAVFAAGYPRGRIVFDIEIPLYLRKQSIVRWGNRGIGPGTDRVDQALHKRKCGIKNPQENHQQAIMDTINR
jgi:hypothetical protein